MEKKTMTILIAGGNVYVKKINVRNFLRNIHAYICFDDWNYGKGAD